MSEDAAASRARPNQEMQRTIILADFQVVRQTVAARRPHHLNVAGDFYVEDGCCLSCGVPQHLAPDLFASLDEHDQCFVKRQPDSDASLSRMIEVMKCQDIGCVRFRGTDQAVDARLRVEGLDEYMDRPAEELHKPKGVVATFFRVANPTNVLPN